MKSTKISLLLILSLALIISACGEDFNPVKGLPQTEYVLTSVIRGDTSFQVATLYRAYEDIETESVQFIGDVDVRVWLADTVIFFKEDSTLLNDRWKRFYSANDTRFKSLNDRMEIEAVIPGITRLLGKTFKPQQVVMNFAEGEAAIPNSRGYSRFVWTSPESYVYFQPKLTLKYFVISQEDTLELTELIPPNIDELGIVDSIAQRRLESVYILPNSSVNYVMDKISEGDPIKSKYHIHSAELEIITLDQNLSRFYGAANREFDSFTIKVDATDFSNIENGYGIFGSLRTDKFQIKVIRSYIESFGYKALLPD